MNCTIQGIEIDAMYSVILPLNNWGQYSSSLLHRLTLKIFFLILLQIFGGVHDKLSSAFCTSIPFPKQYTKIKLQI